MYGPGNALAFLMIALWLPISLAFFARFPPPRAALYSMMGGMLLLPLKTSFDFPLVPALDKELIPNFAILAGVIFFGRHRLRGVKLGRGLDWLVILGILGLFGTVRTNMDVLTYAWRRLPALSNHDAFSDSVFLILQTGIPFVLGRALFRTSRDLRMLMVVIVGIGLVHSVLVLWEIRMSPQLHRTFYGFFQHSFHQTVRGNSFRPMVFMAHGLPLSFFVMTTAVAATSLHRIRAKVGSIPGTNAAAFLGILLVLCRSIASIIYGMVAIPLVAFTKPKFQLTVASGFAILVLLYPVLRVTGQFPTQAIIDTTMSLSESRAVSLQYRFDNEDEVLEKINKRILFGWGGYGRFHIFDAKGIHRTTTDGYWIIALGAWGAVGFATKFGMLTIPVFLARARIGRIRSWRDRQLISALGLIVALYSVDLLPNGFYMSFYIMLSGALTGLVPGIIADQRRLDARRRRQPKRDRRAAIPADSTPRSPGRPSDVSLPDDRPASLSAILKRPGS